MSNILDKLKGGDLRSKGRSEEVVEDILNNSSLFKEVFEGMVNEDPVVRMRSADAIEKVSLKHPEYLNLFKSRLINEISQINQQEVRWHLVQMFSYIIVSHNERDQIIKILLSYLNNDKSKIVKTFAMQTLSDFAERDNSLIPETLNHLEKAINTGSPAMISRAKKLIQKLKKIF